MDSGQWTVKESLRDNFKEKDKLSRIFAHYYHFIPEGDTTTVHCCLTGCARQTTIYRIAYGRGAQRM